MDMMEEGNEYSEDDFNNEILQESSAQQENKYCELFRNMLIKLKPQTSNLKPQTSNLKPQTSATSS
jgi:hypothetical protein